MKSVFFLSRCRDAGKKIAKRNKVEEALLRFLWLAVNVAKAERVEKKYFVIESYNKIEKEREREKSMCERERERER